MQEDSAAKNTHLCLKCGVFLVKMDFLRQVKAVDALTIQLTIFSEQLILFTTKVKQREKNLPTCSMVSPSRLILMEKLAVTFISSM